MTRPAYLLAALIFVAGQAWSGIRPSFRVQSLAWNSTDIVFVNEGHEPGIFVVEEVLKGTLSPGERITLVDMKPFQTESGREVYGWINEKTGTAVQSHRLMVFLKRSQQNLGPAEHFGGMQVSFAWLENGDAYGYRQVINPGPTLLTQLNETEQKLRDTATEISAERASFERAVLLPDKRERGAALGAFLISKNHLARFAAIERLKQCACEKDALPGLHAVLADNTRLPLHQFAISALPKVGGQQVGGELLQRLRTELTFWKTVGPRLEPEWWSQTAPNGEVLLAHYEATKELVHALREVGQPAVPVIRELRDLSRTMDQLGSPSGLLELTRECNVTLALTGEAD